MAKWKLTPKGHVLDQNLRSRLLNVGADQDLQFEQEALPEVLKSLRSGGYQNAVFDFADIVNLERPCSIILPPPNPNPPGRTPCPTCKGKGWI